MSFNGVSIIINLCLHAKNSTCAYTHAHAQVHNLQFVLVNPRVGLMASHRLFVQHDILICKFYDESLFKIFPITLKPIRLVEPLTLLIFLPSQLSSNFIHMVVSYILIINSALK